MSEEIPDVAPDEDLVDISESVWKTMLASLREFRIARKISLRELSTKIGVHSTHLSRVEKYLTVPNVLLVLRWAQALKIDFGTLYYEALKMRDKDPEIG